MQLTQTHLPLIRNDFPKLGVVESQTLHRFVLASKFSDRNTKRRDISLVSERSISNCEHSVVLSDVSLIRPPKSREPLVQQRDLLVNNVAQR